jgi:hypothetical protein
MPITGKGFSREGEGFGSNPFSVSGDQGMYGVRGASARRPLLPVSGTSNEAHFPVNQEEQIKQLKPPTNPTKLTNFQSNLGEGGVEALEQTSIRTENRPYAPRSSQEFYERVKAAGAFENIDDGTPILDERRQRLLEAYMTTPATMKELCPLAGGVGYWRVNQLLWDAFKKIRDNLPQELRNEYRGLTLTTFVKPKKPGNQ